MQLRTLIWKNIYTNDIFLTQVYKKKRWFFLLSVLEKPRHNLPESKFVELRILIWNNIYPNNILDFLTHMKRNGNWYNLQTNITNRAIVIVRMNSPPLDHIVNHFDLSNTDLTKTSIMKLIELGLLIYFHSFSDWIKLTLPWFISHIYVIDEI